MLSRDKTKTVVSDFEAKKNSSHLDTANRVNTDILHSIHFPDQQQTTNTNEMSNSLNDLASNIAVPLAVSVPITHIQDNL